MSTSPTDCSAKDFPTTADIQRKLDEIKVRSGKTDKLLEALRNYLLKDLGRVGLEEGKKVLPTGNSAHSNSGQVFQNCTLKGTFHFGVPAQLAHPHLPEVVTPLPLEAPPEEAALEPKPVHPPETPKPEAPVQTLEIESQPIEEDILRSLEGYSYDQLEERRGELVKEICSPEYLNLDSLERLPLIGVACALYTELVAYTEFLIPNVKPERRLPLLELKSLVANLSVLKKCLQDKIFIHGTASRLKVKPNGYWIFYRYKKMKKNEIVERCLERDEGNVYVLEDGVLIDKSKK